MRSADWRASIVLAVCFWLPVVAWAGLIFAFSAQPNLTFVPERTLDFIVRKAGHAFVFGVLAVLLRRALAVSAVRSATVWSLGLTVAYAASDEFHQAFTSNRHPSPLDVGIDSLGALLFLAALAVGPRLWARRSRRRYSSASAVGSPRMLKPPST